MAIMLPETIAQALNAADDAKAIDESLKHFLKSRETIKRYPADVAFMLKRHFDMNVIFEQWAQPKSKQEKDAPYRVFDWRGRDVTEKQSNEPMLLDVTWRKAQGAEKASKVHYYRRLVENTSVGGALADMLDTFRKVKAGPDAYDLSAINTIVPIETSELSGDGTTKVIMRDARGMSGVNVAKYAARLETKLNDLATQWSNAVLLLRQWHDINTRPEFKGHVELDWNWANGRNPDDGLHANGLPFILRSVERTKNETGETVIRYPADKPLRWEDVLKFDLDKAATAISAEGSKVSPYTAILDNPWKVADDKAAAGQGTTAEQKARKSAIKVTGEGNMADVLTECVYFFRDGGTVAAFKNWLYNSCDGAERDDVMFNLASVKALLTDLVDDDVVAAYNRVNKATEEREAQEKARLAKRQEQTAAAEREPTAADKWRATELARQREAERVLKPTAEPVDSGTGTASPELEPKEQPKKKTAAGGKKAAAAK